MGFVLFHLAIMLFFSRFDVKHIEVILFFNTDNVPIAGALWLLTSLFFVDVFLILYWQISSQVSAPDMCYQYNSWISSSIVFQVAMGDMYVFGWSGIVQIGRILKIFIEKRSFSFKSISVFSSIIILMVWVRYWHLLMDMPM